MPGRPPPPAVHQDLRFSCILTSALVFEVAVKVNISLIQKRTVDRNCIQKYCLLAM